jgi:hypothetical protein
MWYVHLTDNPSLPRLMCQQGSSLLKHALGFYLPAALLNPLPYLQELGNGSVIYSFSFLPH